LAHPNATFSALLQLVARRFIEERCLQVASSLTFTTLLALVPLLAVALTLIAAFPAFRDLNAHLQAFVVENLMPESAEALSSYVQQFARNAGRLTALGLAILIVTGALTLMTIENEFNQIWRVSRHRRTLQRLLVYWTLVTVGPVLVGASLSLTSWLVSLSLGLVDDLPAMGIVLLRLVPFVLTVLAFALLYVAMPNRRIRRADAALGGLVAGAAFEVMKRGFGLYIAHFPTYERIYGAFATVPIFLLWIYLSWVVVLCGAVLVAVLPQWRAGVVAEPRGPGSDFFAALGLLRELRTAHRLGALRDEVALAGGAAVSIDRAERLLDAMAVAGWVAKAEPAAWVLARDAAAIRLADLWRRFALGPGAVAVQADEARRLRERIEAVLDLSLEEYCAGPQEPARD
jgi:membrane protein